jgi:hypothetical protein
VSTAQTLGRYRDELVSSGFSREEALDLVGHAAPMGVDEVNTTPARARRELPVDSLRVVVLAGNREEAERWKTDRIVRNQVDHPDRVILTAGGSSALLGLSGPLAVMTLPGFYRLPADQREGIEDIIRRANAMA